MLQALSASRTHQSKTSGRNCILDPEITENQAPKGATFSIFDLPRTHPQMTVPQPYTPSLLQERRYRYGFNGKELDPQGMGGGGSTYDYGFRIYNAQLGKFLSTDPLSKEYPWYTPYQFAGNKVIWAIDLDGLEEFIKTEYYNSAGELFRTEIQIVKGTEELAESGSTTQLVHLNKVIYDCEGNAEVLYAGSVEGTFSTTWGAPAGSSSAFTPQENAALWFAYQARDLRSGIGYMVIGFPNNTSGLMGAQWTPILGGQTRFYPNPDGLVTIDVPTEYGAPDPSRSAYVAPGTHATPVENSQRFSTTGNFNNDRGSGADYNWVTENHMKFVPVPNYKMVGKVIDKIDNGSVSFPVQSIENGGKSQLGQTYTVTYN